MKTKIRKVIISGGREIGGLNTFSHNLAQGFNALGIQAEVDLPKNILTRWTDLRDPHVLKILSTTAVFIAPFARNAICIAHGFPRADAQGWIKWIAIILSFKLTNPYCHFVAVSDYVAIHLRSIFNLRVDAVIRNPLSKEFLEATDLKPLNRNYITFVGRLHSVKNIGKLLPGIEEFLKNNPDFKACIIGDGELRNDLVQAANYNKRIEFKGSLDSQDVREWLMRSSVFISGCETEALGIAYLEALSQGCAVVMPACGGGLEIAPHLIGKKIFLFPLSFDTAEIFSSLSVAAITPQLEMSLEAFQPKAVATAYLNLVSNLK